MPQPLLSRFDLIFVLLDEADEQKDRLLSEHVMAMHSNEASSRGRASGILAFVKPLSEIGEGAFTSCSDGGREVSGLRTEPLHLGSRLSLRPGETVDAIPPVLLRKYFSYAKHHCHPTLGERAGSLLRNFFLTLRRGASDECAPITIRQLEALLRLAEARARSELRDEVTEEDARDVMDIMRASFAHTVVDEFGKVDFQKVAGGRGKAKETRRVVAELTRMSEQKESALFHVEELKETSERLKVSSFPSFEEFLEHLNAQGYVLKRGPKLYCLQTSQMAAAPHSGR